MIMISLQVLMWLYGNREINEQVKFLLSTQKIAEKMHLVALLSEKARARTRLTSKLIATDDVFDKDEIVMQLGKNATAFTVIRAKFLSLPLNASERNLIEQQKKLIPWVLKNHRLAVELAMSDDASLIDESKRLQYKVVLPGQGKVVDIFMEMLKKYEDEINTQTKNAQNNHIENTQFRYFLLFVFLSVALFIIVYVSRKVYLIEKKLFIEKKRTHITLMSIGDAVITTDAKGIILDCNKVAEGLIRLPAKEILGKLFSSVVNLSNHEGIIEDDFMTHSLLDNKEVSTGNFQLNFKNSCIHIEILLSPILEGKHKAGCVITFRDISEKRELEKKLTHQAKYDALTGLLNRYSFEQICHNIIEKNDKRSIYSLCVLDLDHFKNINDLCGHESGDLVLKQLANIMAAVLRENDYLSRIGGDEFTIILENCNEKNAAKTMQKIIDNISAYSFSYHNKAYKVGCSIGITELAAGDSSCSEIFKRADMSCYQAKNTGRNKVVLFSQLPK